jgi:hypothetical protein
LTPVRPYITVLPGEQEMLKIDNEVEKVTMKNILLTTAIVGFCLILSFFAPTTASATWGFSMGENGDYPLACSV